MEKGWPNMFAKGWYRMNISKVPKVPVEWPHQFHQQSGYMAWTCMNCLSSDKVTFTERSHSTNCCPHRRAETTPWRRTFFAFWPRPTGRETQSWCGCVFIGSLTAWPRYGTLGQDVRNLDWINLWVTDTVMFRMAAVHTAPLGASSVFSTLGDKWHNDGSNIGMATCSFAWREGLGASMAHEKKTFQHCRLSSQVLGSGNLIQVTTVKDPVVESLFSMISGVALSSLGVMCTRYLQIRWEHFIGILKRQVLFFIVLFIGAVVILRLLRDESFCSMFVDDSKSYCSLSEC